MFPHLPATVGLPSRRPVVTENLAHQGLLMMENRSERDETAGSLAVGTKLYQELTRTAVGGVPEILGAASATELISDRAQTSAKKIADAPSMGARLCEVRMDNPRGYDTGLLRYARVAALTHTSNLPFRLTRPGRPPQA